MDSIVPILSAAGLGGIVGSFLQAWLTRRAALDERIYREKREAYLNFLVSLKMLEIEDTLLTQKDVGYWLIVCDLFASKKVRNNMKRLRETNPQRGQAVHPERPGVIADIMAAMRTDLGIVSSEKG